MKSNQKKHATTKSQKRVPRSKLLGALLFVIGACLLLYPSISNYHNARHHSEAIAVYSEKVKAIDNSDIKEKWEDAVRYNDALFRYQQGEELEEGELRDYDSVLSIDETGIMGYVDIPKIHVHLPVYHGTEATTLQEGIGHMQTSSFPVGGKNTNAVLTGHTGLPSARLFTDLDQLKKGDWFRVSILGTDMYYVIEDIFVILPKETDKLKIKPGEDMVSLVTCTPYGVNTHRLVIQGYRTHDIPPHSKSIEKQAEKNALIPMLIALLFVLLFIAVLIFLLLRRRKLNAPTRLR